MASPGPRQPSGLSPLGLLVRRADPDRYLTALFAPAPTREALFALYAFNNELARAREAASLPHLALIRLHWWREVVLGEARRHEVAEPLALLLDAGRLDRAELAAIIDAREDELETPPTLAAWQAMLLAGPGGLALAAGRLLGRPGLDVLRHRGAAYGAAGQLRSVVALAAQERCLLPEDVLAEHGLSPEAVIAEPGAPALRPVFATLARHVAPWLAGRVPPEARAAALPAVLARRDLRHPGELRPRGAGDRLAVALAALGLTSA